MMSEASLCLWSFGSLASVSCHGPPKLAGDGTMTRPGSCDRCGTSVRGVFGTGGLASTGPPGHVSSSCRVATITHLSSLEPRGLRVRRIWLGHCRGGVASGGLRSRMGQKRGTTNMALATSKDRADDPSATPATGPRPDCLRGKTAKNPTTWLPCREKAEVGSSQASRRPAN